MNNETSVSSQDVLSSDQLSLKQMIEKQSTLNQSNSNDLNVNQSSQNQVDKQIEHSIDEALSNENQSILLDKTDTIDLSISSQRLEKIHRKRKTKEERQNTLKKKYDSIKISTLMLSVDETLKNAQKILIEDLKIVKIEHVIIQQLINQIERARANLDLTDETSIIIDQTQTTKSFEFASIDLTKKADKCSSYCGTMSKNFQQLKQAMKKKMTRYINERLKNQSIQSRSADVSETSKNLSTKSAKVQTQSKSNSKETSETSKKTLIAKRAQTSEKSRTNAETNSTTSSFI
jgi:hypothetical protein